LALRLKVCPLAGAGVEDVAELDPVVGVAALVGVEELLELELPQPASTSSPAATARIATIRMESVFAVPAAWSLTIQILLGWLGNIVRQGTAKRGFFPSPGASSLSRD
jgi:hypothetical protein